MYNCTFDTQQHTSFVFSYWLEDEEDDTEWLEEEYEDSDEDDEEAFKLAEDNTDISDADF